jgi:hypothetical protein
MVFNSRKSTHMGKSPTNSAFKKKTVKDTDASNSSNTEDGEGEVSIESDHSRIEGGGFIDRTSVKRHNVGNEDESVVHSRIHGNVS